MSASRIELLHVLAVSKEGTTGDSEGNTREVSSMGSCKARSYRRTSNWSPGASLGAGPLRGWRATFLQI